MPRHPEVHFRLKAKNKKGDCAIYLQFIYNRNRLFFSFGQSVNFDDWNFNKERIKKKDKTTLEGKFFLNDLLERLQNLCLTSYHESMKDGIPNPAYIKTRLKNLINQNRTEADPEKSDFFLLADRFIRGEIKNRGKDKSISSLQNYHAVTKHLKNFQKATKYSITFENINLDFFYKYTTYLKDTLGLSPNTIAKDISIIKVFMGEAVDLRYTTNNEFRHKKFSYSEIETDAVYVTEKELEILYKFDFSKTKRLENVRDLFVFGAWVGLRFSDFSNIMPENIIEIDSEYFIKIVTQKTKELVIIPCHPIVLDIFEKYKHNPNKLPNTISNQKFNDYIKDVFKAAGFNEKGRLANDINLELWQCVSSHTARRSFATNYYLQGFPVIDLMKITGHKTEKAFMKYIRISKLDAAKRLSSHMKKMWSEKMLRVA
ncbi:site-specific integrase [Ginsengibacter hankyongi]|uniref:Site-specific integrase n=1 Tax=Ginsengibacter hankyongi TaxID=2607284 RepID=A0A5J5ILU5_9BACT|nr:site-specific integrase [Ginsengibacter hankyongi]KAA9042045.1 site-specific integrase [Ginsengibacter hankyongi]